MWRQVCDRLQWTVAVLRGRVGECASEVDVVYANGTDVGEVADEPMVRMVDHRPSKILVVVRIVSAHWSLGSKP